MGKSKSKCFITFLFVLLLSSVEGQILSGSDLRLTIPGRDIKDSSITINQVLDLEKIEGNFPWILIKEITVVLAGICVNGQGVNSVTCEGNTICRGAKKLLEHCRPGSFVMIESNNVTNRSGIKLPVAGITLRVK